MSKVTIKTQIKDQLTRRIILDNAPGEEMPNYDSATVVATANSYADLLPDCQISVSVSNGDFIYIPPRNMMRDEEIMNHKDFMAKWHRLRV